MFWIRKKGLFFCSKEREFQKKIQKEIVLPEVVNTRKNQAFELIRQEQVGRELKKDMVGKRALRYGLGVVCFFMFLIGTGIYLNVTNPVLAQELPVVGGIFKDIQKEISYWQEGNVLEHAVPLEEKKKSEDADNAYRKNSNGVSVRVSEVYANPQKIYISLKIKSREPLTEIGYFETESAKIMQLKCDYYLNFSFVETEGIKENEQLQTGVINGILLNDTAYEGVLVLDVQEKIPESCVLGLRIERIAGRKSQPEEWRGGYTETEYWALSKEERERIQKEIPKTYTQYPNPFQYICFDGVWEFEIPIAVDESETMDLEINDVNADGYGIANVMKTVQNLYLHYVLPQEKEEIPKIVLLDAEGKKLPGAVISYKDKNEYIETYTTKGHSLSSVDVYFLGENFYEEVYATGRWGELLQANREGNTSEGKQLKAMLEEYNIYHKTILFEKGE